MGSFEWGQRERGRPAVAGEKETGLWKLEERRESEDCLTYSMVGVSRGFSGSACGSWRLGQRDEMLEDGCKRCA